MEAPNRKPGRPKGHRLSEETKAKIRAGVRAARRKEREHASTVHEVPVDVRLRVIERDGKKCRGCHEKDDLKVFVFVEDGDLTDLNNLAYLCRWCRRTSRDLGKTSAEQVP